MFQFINVIPEIPEDLVNVFTIIHGTLILRLVDVLRSREHHKKMKKLEIMVVRMPEIFVPLLTTDDAWNEIQIVL